MWETSDTQTVETNENQIDGNDNVQKTWKNQNEDARDQRHNRLDMDETKAEIHARLL
jgi:hypothetical protein